MKKQFGLRYTVVQRLEVKRKEKWFQTEKQRDAFVNAQIAKDCEFEIESYCDEG